MAHPYFEGVNWDAVRYKKSSETNDSAPHKPNPNKYMYILNNSYPTISNLKGEMNKPRSFS